MSTRAILWVVLFLVGCAGKSTIDELSVSLNDLQSVSVGVLPLGQRTVSANGREHTSNYFSVKNGEYESAVNAKTRNYAVITILGDRRPYQLEVIVVVERRTEDGEYYRSGYDEGLARVITRRIQKALHERREDRNIIDDFRVF